MIQPLRRVGLDDSLFPAVRTGFVQPLLESGDASSDWEVQFVAEVLEVRFQEALAE